MAFNVLGFNFAVKLAVMKKFAGLKTLSDPTGLMKTVKTMPEVMAGKIPAEKAHNALADFTSRISRDAGNGSGGMRTKLEAQMERSVKKKADVKMAASLGGISGGQFGAGLNDASGMAVISSNAGDGAWGDSIGKARGKLKGGVSTSAAPSVSGDTLGKMAALEVPAELQDAVAQKVAEKLEKMAGGLFNPKPTGKTIEKAVAGGAGAVDVLGKGFGTGVKDMGLNKTPVPHGSANTTNAAGQKAAIHKSLGGQGQKAGVMAKVDMANPPKSNISKEDLSRYDSLLNGGK
jgi:hypothetical protein